MEVRKQVHASKAIAAERLLLRHVYSDFSESDLGSTKAFFSARGLEPPKTGAGLQSEVKFCLDGVETVSPAAAEVSMAVNLGSSVEADDDAVGAAGSR